jgi:phosphoglycerol transferase MdoB-like AlkP superfamily enzyme
MTTLVEPTEKSAGISRPAWIAVVAIIHVLALGLLLIYENGAVPIVAALLTWGLLNFFWLLVLRRPAAAALLSLGTVIALTILSLFKHQFLSRTITFLDLMMVDTETTQFLFNVFPEIGFQIVVAALIFLPLLGLTAWLDPLRMRRLVALAGFVLCFFALAGLSLLSSLDREDEFFDRNFVSKFARSTAVAVIDLTTGQLLESDARAAERLDPPTEPACQTDQKRPHIFLVLDESSFDATLMPGIKVPANYRNHFRSFDGKERRLVVEGAGGPTWYTEYNVLTGLSSRSYGRFAEGVTRIAAGRVNRGLPHVLRRCGYQTFSAYPQPGAFLNARGFQTSAGIERFLQAKDIGSRERNTDDFYYDFALRTFSWERGNGPVFYFLYTVANHFPWNFTFRPDLTPGFKGFGNRPDVDEYVRRQIMSAQYYAEFLAKLRTQFPDESFLIVRFGDHQPGFARQFINPRLVQEEVIERIRQFDSRYFTSYYAIDAINFTPVDLSSALDTLDAPHLPLVVLEAAGIPLDGSFAEQKKILQRCRGQFYLCSNGAEARRFNRMLIDAGLIRGL